MSGHLDDSASVERLLDEIDRLEGELGRLRAHEERRRRVGRLDLVQEDTWLASLDDRERGRIARELNAVDRATAAGRRAREAA